MGGLKIKFFCCFILSAMICLTGCTGPEKETDPPFILKTPFMSVSTIDFLEELDLKKTAYPYTISDNSAEYNEMVIHLVKMLSQEIILLSAAADKQVIVTDQEVQLAEEEFKKEYPDTSFDQMLLENAISYSFWKKRLKKDMIIDKLIDQELKTKIEISPQDIVEYFKKNNHPVQSMVQESEIPGVNKKMDEKDLIASLRLQKTQEQYDEWMQQLELLYPVEIDKEKLKTFLLDLEIKEGN